LAKYQRIMRLPSLRNLRTFQLAGRHLSFKDAADEMCVTASAVSHQVRKLESELGVRLFDRHTRSLEFTVAGRKYFEFLDAMFSRLEDETRQLWDQYGRDILRLCVPPFFASEALLPRMSDFQERAKSDLRLSTRPSAMKIHPPEADASVLLGAPQWPQLVTHQLFERKVVVACSRRLLAKAEVVDYRDLDGQTLIVHDSRPDEWSLWARELGIASPRPGKLLRFDTMSSVARAAEQGMGFALISWPLAQEWFRSGALVRVFDQEVSTGESFFFAYREEDATRIEIRSLCDWVLGEFRIAA